MTIASTATGIRLTSTPVVEAITAAAIMFIGGLCAAGTFAIEAGSGSDAWIRGAAAVMALIGLILILRVERLDHHFDRRRGTIELSWRSLLRSRRRVLLLADVTGVVVEEDPTADYGRPSRIVLRMKDTSQVQLSENYASLRGPVVRASRELSRFLGMPLAT